MSLSDVLAQPLTAARTMTMNRLGFHYFNDTRHYSLSDLHIWLPQLQALGAAWITLIAPLERAIPEHFVRGLQQAGIEPILHFPFSLDDRRPPDSFQILARSYAEWGVRYVALFDRPNTRSAWRASSWSQTDLVERFLDRFLPLAELCLGVGLIPVFPPLEPGGDYWDTAFLQSALRSMQRRNQVRVLESLVLGAYALVAEQRLDWGAGGPERWPSARPYFTPRGQQDQRGFFIFDWYRALTQAVLGQPLPMLLLRAGILFSTKPETQVAEIDEITHAQKNLALARLLFGQQLHMYGQETFGKVPAEVLACNFWPLTATPEDPHVGQAWFRPDGSTLPIIGALRQWMAERGQSERGSQTVGPLSMFDQGHTDTRPIVHYLLLPLSDWGINEKYLEIARPIIQRLHPNVGFSLEEASQAAHVIVIGNEQEFSHQVIQELHHAGCVVERIVSIGTNIASKTSDHLN